MSSDGGALAVEANEEFIDGFVKYLATTVLSDEQAEADFRLIVEALTSFSMEALPIEHRTLLANKLQDPSLSLTFASDLAAEMVPGIVHTLLD